MPVGKGVGSCCCRKGPVCPECCNVTAPFLEGGAIPGDLRAASIEINLTGGGPGWSTPGSGPDIFLSQFAGIKFLGYNPDASTWGDDPGIPGGIWGDMVSATHAYIGAPTGIAYGVWEASTEIQFLPGGHLGGPFYTAFYRLVMYCSNSDIPPWLVCYSTEAGYGNPAGIWLRWDAVNSDWVEVPSGVPSQLWLLSAGLSASGEMPAGCCCPTCCCMRAPWLPNGCVAGDWRYATLAVTIAGFAQDYGFLGLDLVLSGDGTWTVTVEDSELTIWSMHLEKDGFVYDLKVTLNCVGGSSPEPSIVMWVAHTTGNAIQATWLWTPELEGWFPSWPESTASIVQTHAEPLPVDCCDNPGIPLTCACESFKAPNGWFVIPNNCLLDYLTSNGTVATTSCGNCPVVVLRPSTIGANYVEYRTLEGMPGACGYSPGGCGIDVGGIHAMRVACGDGVIEYTTTTVGLLDFPNQTLSCDAPWPSITYSSEYGGAAGYLTASPCGYLTDGEGNARFNCVAGGCVGVSRWEHPSFPSGVPIYDYYAALYAGSVTYVPF